MNRSLLALAAAALLYTGCNNYSPVAPSPKEEGSPTGQAFPGEGGVTKIDGDNTKITFVGTKPGGRHEGGFKTLSGEIRILTMAPGQQIP